MNSSTSYQRHWILIVLLGFVSSAQAQVEIDTRVGSGADSEIANDNALFGTAFADFTQGTQMPNSMNTRFSLLAGQAAERHRAAFMRFDITGVSGDLSEAGIKIHSVDQSRTLEVWGLNDSDEAGIEDWNETTITYNNAPGITNLGPETIDGVVDTNRYTFLGTWVIPGPRSNGFGFDELSTTFPPPVELEPKTQYTDPANLGVDFSSNLSNHVAADTNDLLTLLFFPTESGGNIGLRTKEWEFMDDGNGNQVVRPEFVIAPTLALPNAEFGPVGDPADLNMDGFVDGLDLGILLGNFNQSGISASGGELNATDPVDGLDLGILLGGWSPPAQGGLATVPEPSTCFLLALAWIGAIAGRTCTTRR